MKKLSIVALAGASVGLVLAPVAQANCCEDEFDWADPYVNALRNHDLGYLVDSRGIPVALAAEAVCKGSSANGIADEYDIGLATAEQIARAVYLDVCPEMAP
ncbi:hypothetical protein [Mycobacterium sp. 852002-51152_SCH6134967]|uniref:hypothetical protein n=1 Tax=Mycobacterium sp. 852002-51152_SCH6134967 TaxID=1834096 RepID=UPI000B09D6C7|nr:hypothetical protein [Mycobacterium sp. 852002-51152_SCH6134967]